MAGATTEQDEGAFLAEGAAAVLMAIDRAASEAEGVAHLARTVAAEVVPREDEVSPRQALPRDRIDAQSIATAVGDFLRENHSR